MPRDGRAAPSSSDDDSGALDELPSESELELSSDDSSNARGL